jgi:hypothetical protein
MSLIDTFMPNDLCARCDEKEPSKDVLTARIKVGNQEAKLFFCSHECQSAFVRGAEAIKELPDVF